MHFYADDSVIYCHAETVSLVIKHLQPSFDCMQLQFLQLRLMLNASKTKGMLFSNRRKVPQTVPTISATPGLPIDVITSYKYLGTTIDEDLMFKPHNSNLLKKLELELGFSFVIKLIPFFF